MLKNILIAVLSVALMGMVYLYIKGAQVENKEISFFEGSFQEALDNAQTLNKPLFVDFYTSWCGPCKKMVATTFKDDSVADYYNENFVNYKMMMDNNPEICKKYGINKFPTYIYFNNGVPQYKKIGFYPEDEFLEMGRNVISGADNYSAVLAYEAGDSSINAMIEAYKQLTIHQDSRRPGEILHKLFDKKIASTAFFDIIKAQNVQLGGGMYNYILENRDLFYESVGSEVDSLLLQTGYNQIAKAYMDILFKASYLQGNPSKKHSTASNFAKVIELNNLLFNKRYRAWLAMLPSVVNNNESSYIEAIALRTLVATPVFKNGTLKKTDYEMLLSTAEQGLSKTKNAYLYLVKAGCQKALGIGDFQKTLEEMLKQRDWEAVRYNQNVIIY